MSKNKNKFIGNEEEAEAIMRIMQGTESESKPESQPEEKKNAEEESTE